MKRLSRVLVLSLLSIQAISINSNASLGKYDISQNSNEVKNEEKLKVEKISKSAIKLINDVVQGKDTKKSIELNELSNEDISALSEQIERGKKKSDFLKKIGKGYKNIKSNFTVKNSTLEGNLAKITLEEYTELEENESYSNENIAPKYVKNHEFTFEVIKNNKVKLIKYKWLDDPFLATPEELAKLKIPSNIMPATLDLNVPNQSQNQSRIFLSNLLNHKRYLGNKPRNSLYRISSLSLIAQSSSLNRQAMVEYATKWWNSRNPDYFVYDQDCTNYASQLLRAGGITFRNALNDRSSPLSWWYNMAFPAYAYRQSDSWSVAPNFHSFFSSSPDIAQAVNRTSYLNVGDIVQVGSDGYLYHTMIVTSKRSSDSMLYLTGHTNNRFQLPVYDIIADGKQIYTWKLTGNI
jgi:Putative amidase domain